MVRYGDSDRRPFFLVAIYNIAYQLLRLRHLLPPVRGRACNGLCNFPRYRPLIPIPCRFEASSFRGIYRTGLRCVSVVILSTAPSLREWINPLASIRWRVLFVASRRLTPAGLTRKSAPGGFFVRQMRLGAA
ncbi:MAG: hypothetical protein A2514_14495 [Gammaproteobacteria bacterium RIFOXYD12_FULL_61_37]|nr:MAG: hypothetical protein A2514_14495 [Gammaproteobacteria bacterium RIFOXYD12_FULL_61_37]